ncbi:hypothetical protein MPSEU_000667600 [Mayamaea pseudoterrestris]|nr:hypothetical protein MPSEU_000667600 [Mayamaea pseudoterrestris]
MPFWSKGQPSDKSCQQGLEDDNDNYVEQPSMISVKSSNSRRTSNDAEAPPSCLRRLWSELNPCQPWFTTADTFGRKIDIPESFAPPSCYAFLFKLAEAVLITATLVLTWIDTSNPQFYLAYFTYWALLLATLYSWFSLYNTIMAARTPQPPVSAGFIIRTTWALFTLASHTSACASILWWVLIFEAGVTKITFYNISPHLITACVVWLDGFVVNRIPVRWMMWYGLVLPLDILWGIWSVAQSYSGIGNPDANDASGADPDNDDAIYGALAWQDYWVRCLIITLIAIFVMGPLVFMLMWLCSLYIIPCACYKDKRKYMDSYKDQEDTRPTVDDVEEGSIFARWR